MTEICPCHSNDPYEACCFPYHSKEKVPQTSLELMRSRYSAYAKTLPDYIIETTHTKNEGYNANTFEWTQSILEAYGQTEFKGLEILHHKDKADKGCVTFLAQLFEKGRNVSFQETSDFIRENGRWYYLSGKKNESTEST